MSERELENGQLFFAHDTPRESQRRMIDDGIETLKAGGFLLAAAPTGIGKTAAALASSLTAANHYGFGKEIPKILFLTGRQSQHRIVVDTIREINNRIPQGFSKIKLVDIIGRRSMCKNVDSKGRCDCEQGVTEAERRFLRSGLEEFIHSKPMHVDQVLKKVENEDICAWATSRDAARSTDIIVCDYNHIFVEGVRESSLPVMGVELENTIIIVDEAHNLPDRIRSGLERTIDDQVFKWALDNVVEYRETLQQTETELDIPESKRVREAKNLEKQINAILMNEGISNWFKEKEFENSESRGDDIRVQTKEFLDVISKAIEGVVEEDLGEKDRIRAMVSRLLAVEIDEEEDSEDDEKNDCTRLAEFLEICINYENNNALALVFDKKETSQDPRITSHLLDPSVVGGPIFNQCLGSILMSGTLFPPEMYSEILGIPLERANCVEYPSGFPLGNRPVLIANDVTTKYTERRESMEGILEHIRSVIINTKGNVAIFAPSYSMLNEIHDHFNNSWTGKLILKEDQGMRKGTLQSIIDRLREQRNMRGAALFGVLSGKLSEGVDYPDNILNSLVCVGLPMPPPSARQDALIEYYTKKFDRNKAWKYASLQPAVNSILQALGRPIRKKEDRAIIVLLEKRLLGQRERNCFPEMQRMQTTSPTRTAERVKSFFQM